MSQRAVAKKLFITTAGINYILNGKVALTVDRIQQFEELFDVQLISITK